MEIIKRKTVNTGGQCWVHYLTVTGLGSSQTIGINEEGFAGYDRPLETVLEEGSIEVWWATNILELASYVGEENAAIIQELTKTIE